MRKHVCSITNSEVLDTRPAGVFGDTGTIRRRRKCLKCLGRISTREIPQSDFDEFVRLKKLFADMTAIIALNTDV